MLKNLLPMAGHTRGNRLPITCELKCGSACAHETPNTSGNQHFRDIVNTAISRRTALGLGGGLAAAVVVAPQLPGETTAALADHGRTPTGEGQLKFKAIAPVPRVVDDMTVPTGYDWEPIIRWGDPLFEDSPEFDLTAQTGASQEKQFGYNSDYLNIISDAENDLTGYLVNNHEYTNENIMFSQEYISSNPRDVIDAGIAAHGFSIVDLERDGRGMPWRYVVGGRRNRRITGMTPFSVDGPASGSDLLKTAADPEGKLVLGTLNNCAGGTTPWGTVLSGEENVDQYFVGTTSPEHRRYGIRPGATSRRWETAHERFNLNNAGYANEANRFGWIVEIDPEDPTSTPVKHTALGRFKHEAGTVQISTSGHAVVYSGDDQADDYLYKFVSRQRYREGDKKRNMSLLSEGTLYVARFNGDSPAAEIDGSGKVPADGAFDGSGTWIPLVQNQRSLVPGMTTDQVLVYTRLAADKMGATKMDRPEDVEPNPLTGKVYKALTNNSGRRPATVDEANPVALSSGGNRDGHVIEITERRGDHTATRFDWNVLLLAGDPKVSTSAYFSGYPKENVSPISCPDNLAFDSQGNLWISTDGQPGKIGYSDALHKVTLEGPNRGRVEQFLAVPADAETCGPVIHDQDDSVFVSVQHPGEGGRWGQHTSYFPDDAPGAGLKGDLVAVPRPCVVQVFSVANALRGEGRGQRDAANRTKGRFAENKGRTQEWNDGTGEGHEALPRS